MSEEWGPWIEHDGGDTIDAPIGARIMFEAFRPDGCTVYSGTGTYAGATGAGDEWDLIRYRVRKPKGLTILQEIAQSPEHELERAI